MERPWLPDIIESVQRETPFALSKDEREIVRHAIKATLQRVEDFAAEEFGFTDELKDIAHVTREGQKDAFAYVIDKLHVVRDGI